MFRSRHLICVASIAVVSSMLAGGSLAQPPGQGGPGGGPGGGRGGPRGRGAPSGLLGLALNPGVQAELKVQDPQKKKIEALSEEFTKRQQQIREQAFPQGMFGNRNNNNNGNTANNGVANANGDGGGNGGAANGGGGNGGGRGNRGGFGPGGPGGGGPGGGGPGGFGGWGGMGMGGWGGFGMGYGGMGLGYGGYGMGWGGMGPAANGGNNANNTNGGGRGGRGQMDPEMAARFQEMREASMALQQSSEQALARILTKSQNGRIKQIQLQLAGVGALLQPDMIEKLTLGEDQVEQIQQLLMEGRQAARENGRQMFDLMREAVPDTSNNNNNAAAADANGNNGGRGRRGPNMRDPAVQAAVKNYMERPETKAKIAEIQSQNQKIDKQLYSAVFRLLSKRQAAAYKKMLGAPFDVAKMSGIPTPAGTNPASTTAKADDDEETSASKPAAKAKAAAKPKRKTLRELRGLDD